MEFRKNNGGRANSVSMLFCLLFLLSYTDFASAGLLQWRQEGDGETSTSAADEAATETSTPEPATETSTPEPATETGTPEVAGPTAVVATTTPPAPTMTSAANTTVTKSAEEASLTSASAAAIATGSGLNGTNDPHMCHVNKTEDGDFLGNPFCKPTPGQIVLIDKSIEAQWDTSIFEANSTDTIWLSYFDNSEELTASESSVFKEDAPDTQGSLIINMTHSFLNKTHGSPANLTLFLVSEGKTLTGPTFMLSNATNTTHTSPSSSSGSNKKLGEEVGIPVGLVIFGVALVGLGAFICMRRRAGRGYGVGRSKGQRAAPAAVATGRGHRRDPSFHDEPTRGVELQNRNRGSTAGDDSWDWGSPVSSPTTGGRGSNAFRDELGRQRNSRGF